MDVNYGYGLMPGDLRLLVKRALIADQQGLCAYTGVRIDENGSHIEHLLPQAHCRRGEEDVAYQNMTACSPGPNAAHLPYGALWKADWPSREELPRFVSPHSSGCERRFRFDLRGRVSAVDGDDAAEETIRRLGLDHARLTSLRHEAIKATLNNLNLDDARRRLNLLETDEESIERRLEPFCFVLKQALRKHIARLEAIRKSKGRR